MVTLARRGGETVKKAILTLRETCDATNHRLLRCNTLWGAPFILAKDEVRPGVSPCQEISRQVEWVGGEPIAPKRPDRS